MVAGIVPVSAISTSSGRRPTVTFVPTWSASAGDQARILTSSPPRRVLTLQPEALLPCHHGHLDQRQRSRRSRGGQVHRQTSDHRGVAELHQPAAVEHGDHSCQRLDIGAVVGRHQRRHVVAALQHGEFGSHPAAELLVERCERLVEQQHVRDSYKRSSDLDHLLLARRQRRGLTMHQRLDVQGSRFGVDTPPDLIGRHPPNIEWERHVAPCREVPDERRRLEDHADVALTRRRTGDVVAVESDGAPIDPIEPRHGPQQRGLAASRGSDDRDDSTVVDRHRHLTEPGRAAAGDGDVVEVDGGHQGITPNTQPSSPTATRATAGGSGGENRAPRPSAASVSASQFAVALTCAASRTVPP